MRVSMAGASIAVDVDANFDRSNWWSSRSKMTEPLAVLGTVIGDPESLAALESLIGNGESWCGGEGLDEDIIGAGRGGEGHLDAHVVMGGRAGGRVAGAGTAVRPCRASVGLCWEKRLEGLPMDAVIIDHA